MERSFDRFIVYFVEVSMKDIQIVDIDYSGKNTEYKKEDNVNIGKISSPWIVPEEGPFYKDSLRVLRGGTDLVPGTDFKAVEEVTDLVKLTGKSVCLYVELSDAQLASGGDVDIIYQRVGMPTISVKKLLQMLEDMVITGKPIDWDTQVSGKPLSQYPAQHSHDIQNPNELVGFGGLVELFTLFTNDQIQNGKTQVQALEKLQTDIYNQLDYIQKLKWGAIMTHIRNYSNPHTVTPPDVNLGNVNNYATATVQQDSEGTRTDLRSTPAGLKRLISETEPVSEDYIMQSELPFGYYGSGIYLPPPITGSFEGLGGDQENSAFCQEGNGWTVGLIRAYDGRVKNLYYIYNKDVLERDASISNWIHTYVQYQHPTFKAAGKTPNYVVSGSNNEVLMIGDCADPGTDTDPSRNAGSYWICESNSTFDPNSHLLKPVDLSAFNNLGFYGRPGMWTLAPVGDWVYLIVSVDAFDGDKAGYYLDSVRPYNWQQRLFRFPRKDLTDPSKSTIVFQAVNVSFDNLERERRNNEPALFLQRLRYNSENLITQCLATYREPIADFLTHRRRAFIVVPNPNNKRLARVKVVMLNYMVYRFPSGGLKSMTTGFVADYEWDVVSNIWTLSPDWKFSTISVPEGTAYWPTPQTELYCSAADQRGYITSTYANDSHSWIPGIGFVFLKTQTTGVPPYLITVAQQNPYLDPARDYEAMALPFNQYDNQGRNTSFSHKFKMLSPFGVAGFPRQFSDLYQLTNGTRSTPIEIFIAEDEDQLTRAFYRITEGGADDNYAQRSSLQSAYINKPIYGRKTNSSFGKVIGLDSRIGYVNRPARKNAGSREHGVWSWHRNKVYSNPGAPLSFCPTLNNDSAVVSITPDTDGSVVINLDLDYTLDSVAKQITVKPNPAKQLRIPRAIYYDLINSLLGSHAATVMDIIVDFYFAKTPGVGGDIPPSMLSITYHLRDTPTLTRSIVGVFSWTVASTGVDGIRVAKMGDITYPFKAGTAELKPGVDTNISANNVFALDANNYWEYINQASGLTVGHKQMQILDIGSGGANNIQMRWMPAMQIRTPGNQAAPCFKYAVANGVVTEALAYFAAQGTFSEYFNIYRANAEHGWLSGIPAGISGGAMDLMATEDNSKYIMYGATYVEGNWSVFVNAEVNATFNGYSTGAKTTNWDLRDLTDVYRNQTFYIYCIMDGSSAFYEITKILRNHNSTHILVGKIVTDDFGIVTIERYQNFTISGFPLTRTRDMGIPVSSGTIIDQGSYRFIKRSELYDN